MGRRGREINLDVSSPVPPDGGWGWVVVVAGFFAHVITHGILYSFGIIFIALEEAFQSNKADTSWIGAIASGMVYLTGPLAGKLTSLYGCRVVTIVGAVIAATGNALSMAANSLGFLYLTMGAIAGFGYGLVFLPTIVVVTQYFEKRRSLACSIALGGAGSGAFVFSPLIKYLLPVYGWRGTLLIESGIILNCIACGLIYRPLQEFKVERYSIKENLATTKELEILTSESDDVPIDIERNAVKYETVHTTDHDSSELKSATKGNNSDEGEYPNSNLLKENADVYEETDETIWQRLKDYFKIFLNKTFLIFALSQFLFFFGYYLPFIFLPDKVRLSGYGGQMPALVVAAIGIASVSGRMVLGYVADSPRVSRIWLFNASIVIGGLSTAFVPLYRQLPLLFIYAVVYGCFTGVMLSLTSVVLSDLLGVDKLADAFGINNLFAGIAVLIGPPIAGWLFDETKSYDISFIVPGVTMTLAGVAMAVLPLMKTKTKT